jgi:hypothetical protein
VFGLGLNAKIWVETADSGLWSPTGIELANPGTLTMISHPAAVSSNPGHIDLVALASDNHLYWKTYQD